MEHNQFEWIPDGFKTLPAKGNLVCSISTRFKLNLYIHQAKIRPNGMDRNGLINGKIIATINEMQVMTKIVNNSLSPIWNEMITISCMQLMGTSCSYESNPPIITLELYDYDARVGGFFFYIMLTILFY